MKKRAAVFLDRDGTLNPDTGYPHLPAEATLFEDVIPALRKMQRAGYLFLVASNQSGVARGWFTLGDVTRFNRALAKQLRTSGIQITTKSFYVCPHGPGDSCDCRKPKPGLILRAALDHKVDLRKSLSVGDKETDVEAGRRAGTSTVLLDRGGSAPRTKADCVASTLSEVADFALALKESNQRTRQRRMCSSHKCDAVQE